MSPVAGQPEPIPPHNLDAERAVLGSVLLDPGALPRVVEILKPPDFYTEAHRTIYIAMLKLSGQPVDLITLSEELRKGGDLDRVGGPAALALLVECASIATNLMAYCKIVRDTGALRELIQTTTGITARAYEAKDDPQALAAETQRRLAEINAGLAGAGDGERLVSVRGSEVTEETIRWLWDRRIALGKVNIVAGNPGLGKSLLALDLAARATAGLGLPGGGRVPACDVVILSAEDAAADTVVPRLRIAGADLARCHIVQAVKVRGDGGERQFSLGSDLPMLDRKVAETGAKIIVIDPVSAYLGGRDSYKDAEVRALLAPLARLAERHDAAVVLVAHLGKDEARRAVLRVLGSVAFTAASRSMLAVAEDPGDKARRLVASGKLNNGGCAEGFAYRIVGICPKCSEVGDGGACRVCSVQSVGVIAWEAKPVTGLDADQLLGVQPNPQEREERSKVQKFLDEALRDGPRWSDDFMKEARDQGISRNKLFKAKSGKADTHHDGMTGNWYWALSGDKRKPASPPPGNERVVIP